MQINFFQSIELFSKASNASLQQLAYFCKRHFYKKGTVILDYHESHHVFIYIMKGWVKLFKGSADGEETIIDVLTHGCHCGETFFFKINEEGYYTAQAISDIEMFTLPIPLLKQLIINDHALTVSFLQDALQKQQQLIEQIENLSLQNAMQRVSCFLLRLCDNFHDQESVRLHLPYDKALLASRLGMRPETFSRTLKKLNKQYAIQSNGEYINIPHLQKLVQYVYENRA